MTIITEDKEGMSTSLLLRDSLSPWAATLFAGSNTFLAKKITECNDTEIIVLVDVNPDCKSGLRIFKDLCAKYRESSNVFIVPIFGIEVFILDFLTALKVVPNTYTYGSAGYTGSYGDIMKAFTGTFEHRMKEYCKSLYECKESCLSNCDMSITKTIKYGRFFTENCPCSSVDINCTCAVSLSKKRATLLKSMPILVDVPCIDWKGVYEERVAYYAQLHADLQSYPAFNVPSYHYQVKKINDNLTNLLSKYS